MSRASDHVADRRFASAVAASRPQSAFLHIGESAVLEPLGLDDMHWAMAEQFIRRAANRHGCPNAHETDTACTSPRHAEDAQMALLLLRATGCRDDPEAAWEPGLGYVKASKRRKAGQ